MILIQTIMHTEVLANRCRTFLWDTVWIKL